MTYEQFTADLLVKLDEDFMQVLVDEQSLTKEYGSTEPFDNGRWRVRPVPANAYKSG